MLKEIGEERTRKNRERKENGNIEVMGHFIILIIKLIYLLLEN